MNDQLQLIPFDGTEHGIPKMRLKLVREATVPYSKQVGVSTPEDVAQLFRKLFADEPREVLVVFALSTAHKVIGVNVSTTGGLNASVFEPRSILQYAILQNAAALIIAHNHPSGNPEPSREDIATTNRLATVCRALNTPLRDHIIITDDGYTSLAERGVINN